MLKKIQTIEDIERKQKKKQIIIGSILCAIMVLSVLGYSLSGNENEKVLKKEYNGFKFTRESGKWLLKLQEQEFYFNYLPQELENVSISGFYSLNSYAGKPLYTVNSNPILLEILGNLKGIERYQEVCLEGLNCTSKENLPTKTCESNIIIFNEPDKDSLELKTRVEQNQGCVYIEGDFEKGADAFIYRALGVI